MNLKQKSYLTAKTAADVGFSGFLNRRKNRSDVNYLSGDRKNNQLKRKVIPSAG